MKQPEIVSCPVMIFKKYYQTQYTAKNRGQTKLYYSQCNSQHPRNGTKEKLLSNN